MNRTRVIIIVILGLVSITISVIVYLIVTSKTSTTTPASGYKVLVNSLMGEYRVAVEKGDQTLGLTTEEVEQYASLGYNSPRDILWIDCAAGFIISNYSIKPLIENPLFDDSLGIGVIMSENSATYVEVGCQKEQ